MVEIENGAPEGYNKDFWKPANASGYKKHVNGGGLVSGKAKVAETVYVGPDAVVNGGTVSGNARIEDFAVVNGGTIGDRAVVRGRALVTAGTISGDAILEEDAWLVSGTISGKAKVGAISIIVNSTVTDNAQVYGVMWAVNGKKLSGTAQLRGDLENNFTKEISKGVFYGMVDDVMLNNANYGANLTTPPTEATASIENAKWYAVADDSTASGDTSRTAIPVLPREADLNSSHAMLQVFDFSGKMLGTILSTGDLKFSLGAAGFNNGVYIVRNPHSKRSLRILLNR